MLRRFLLALALAGASAAAPLHADEMLSDGFVVIGDDHVEVVGDGQLFVRNACMAFDGHLRTDDQRFSRTV